MSAGTPPAHQDIPNVWPHEPSLSTFRQPHPVHSWPARSRVAIVPFQCCYTSSSTFTSSPPTPHPHGASIPTNDEICVQIHVRIPDVRNTGHLDRLYHLTGTPLAGSSWTERAACKVDIDFHLPSYFFLLLSSWKEKLARLYAWRWEVLACACVCVRARRVSTYERAGRTVGQENCVHYSDMASYYPDDV